MICARLLLWLWALLAGMQAAQAEDMAGTISGRGRLEGTTRPLQLGFERGGIVSKIRVEAGQVVSAGEILAELRCDPEVANQRADAAEAAALKARLALARNGLRLEEKAIAQSEVELARAQLSAASARAERLIRLSDRVVAAGEIEDAQLARNVAAAFLQVANKKMVLASLPSRSEDLEAASQQFAAAEFRTARARAELAKCSLLAPIKGTVLRRDVEMGDILDPLRPKALFYLTDTSQWRARVELDEADAHRVSNGMKAELRVASSPEIKFQGKVTSFELMVGSRSIRSAQPLERLDRPVRVVYVQLDGCKSPACVVGLEVDVVLKAP